MAIQQHLKLESLYLPAAMCIESKSIGLCRMLQSHDSILPNLGQGHLPRLIWIYLGGQMAVPFCLEMNCSVLPDVL